MNDAGKDFFPRYMHELTLDKDVDLSRNPALDYAEIMEAEAKEHLGCG